MFERTKNFMKDNKANGLPIMALAGAAIAIGIFLMISYIMPAVTGDVQTAMNVNLTTNPYNETLTKQPAQATSIFSMLGVAALVAVVALLIYFIKSVA